MRERSIWCTVWILGALLVIASVDAIPDPPAIDPHMVTVKVPGPKECAESPCGQADTGILLNLLAHFQTSGTIFIEDTKPAGPSAWIAQAGQAADSSPPALVGPSHS
jgi:hypothetical protein